MPVSSCRFGVIRKTILLSRKCSLSSSYPLFRFRFHTVHFIWNIILDYKNRAGNCSKISMWGLQLHLAGAQNNKPKHYYILSTLQNFLSTYTYCKMREHTVAGSTNKEHLCKTKYFHSSKHSKKERKTCHGLFNIQMAEESCLVPRGSWQWWWTLCI